MLEDQLPHLEIFLSSLPAQLLLELRAAVEHFLSYLLQLSSDELLLLSYGLEDLPLLGQKEVSVLHRLQLELSQVLLRKKDSLLLYYQLGAA